MKSSMCFQFGTDIRGPILIVYGS